jgi:outer membrane receptor protein involved in Fe transport
MVHGSKPLSDTNELSSGIDYRYQFGDILNIVPKNLIGQYHKYEYGIYADDKQTFFDKLTLNAGARYNYDEFAKEASTARLGAVYDITEDTLLRGIWSQGFKAPQISDLYLWGGNKELKPEKVTNTEAGIRQSIGDNIYFDFTAYIMKGSNIIQTVNGIKQNTGEFEFKGTETAVNFVMNKNFDGQVNYSTLDPGTQTTGRPGEKTEASIEYKNGKIKGLINGEYVAKYYAGDNSTQKIDDYVVLNTKVDYKIREDLSVFAAVDNITNKEYKIYYNGLYVMPGCSATMGIQYVF